MSGIAVYALSLLWLLLPAVQYLGTLQRTVPAEDRTGPLAPLAALDLTPWYIGLLGATLVLVGLRCYRQSQIVPPGPVPPETC